MDKVKTQVTVAKQVYSIMTDDPAHIKRVGVYVDRRYRELDESSRLPSQAVAVLTALNIADELFAAQDENTRLRRELLSLREKSTRVKKEK